VAAPATYFSTGVFRDWAVAQDVSPIASIENPKIEISNRRIVLAPGRTSNEFGELKARAFTWVRAKSRSSGLSYNVTLFPITGVVRRSACSLHTPQHFTVFLARATTSYRRKFWNL
jgi:hypothetical protein